MDSTLKFLSLLVIVLFMIAIAAILNSNNFYQNAIQNGYIQSVVYLPNNDHEVIWIKK